MIDIIQNNPFRILGVYADASAAEIKRNETKIRRFLEVGKSVSFPTDELGNMPAPIRTAESLDKAISSINLPQEKLYHALFWYSKDNSCFFNECIDYILTDELGYAYMEYFGLLRDTDSSASIQKIVLGNIMFDLSTVKDLCLNGLLTIEKNEETLYYCEMAMLTAPEDYLAAKSKIIAEPISSINSCINTARNADKSTPAKCLQVGELLIDSTKQPLSELRTLINDDDDQDYLRIADSLAKEILQCGINYYNGSNDADKIDKALVIQEYALSIAVGKLTKDRCKKNVDILRKQKKQARTNGDVEAIVHLLEGLEERPDQMRSAFQFVDECVPILSKLKLSLGSNDELYIKVCSAVANQALGFTIKLVNRDTNSKQLAENAMSLIEKIETWDLDPDTRNRIATNKSTLRMNMMRLPAGTSSSSWLEKIDEDSNGCLTGMLKYVVYLAILGAIVWLAQLCS